MKKYMLIACLLIGALQVNSQKNTYNYDDFFYYRHYLFLQTPSVLLTGAAAKAIAGDTAASIQLIRQAASKGMYDTNSIVYNSRIRFVTETAHWAGIKKTIEKNQQLFGNPEAMQILTSDLDHFWKIFDRIDKPGGDKLLMDEYIMKGSQGLRTFFEVRMGLRVTGLIETVRTRKKYFESIRPVVEHLYTFRPRMIEAARKLKTLYPPSIFPPTTFTIGTFSAFGTADGGSGQLVGSEFLCDTNTVVKDELSDWEKSVISDTSRILGILVHELIHVEQQTAPTNTLLERAINEGSADFITQLVLGYNLNSKIHEYGHAHEQELWEKFKTQMNADDISEWLYNGDNSKGVPGDLGYYVGYKICEAYYRKASDKKEAVKDILNVQDFTKFYTESGYAGK